jgi:conjugal transfer pilus assembly protein TraB
MQPIRQALPLCRPRARHPNFPGSTPALRAVRSCCWGRWALAPLGGSWFILGGDDKAKTGDPNAAQTIDTAGLVNRDLSQREFVATYGNRLDAVTREEGAEGWSIPRTEIEAQLAALKAENQAMRVDGQAAIDAISAENAELKTRLAAQPASRRHRLYRHRPMAAGGGYDARARSSQPGGAPAIRRA